MHAQLSCDSGTMILRHIAKMSTPIYYQSMSCSCSSGGLSMSSLKDTTFPIYQWSIIIQISLKKVYKQFPGTIVATILGICSYPSVPIGMHYYQLHI